MSRRYTTTCTLTVGGAERDIAVRAYVETGWDVGSPNGFGATLDGDVEFRIDRKWVSAEEADLGDGDLARATEALQDMALDDDRESCVDYDDLYERDCA